MSGILTIIAENGNNTQLKGEIKCQLVSKLILLTKKILIHLIVISKTLLTYYSCSKDERIPEAVRTKAKGIMELTKNKTGFIINPCINYGGRQEILKAINEIIESGEKDIDVAKFEKHLYTAENGV